MKLIQEADTDKSFNDLMMKMQDAIEKLEKLVPTMKLPASNQPRMLEISSDDLKKLAVTMQKQRDAELERMGPKK